MTTLEFERVTGTVGAFVRGVDVRSPGGDDVAGSLRTALAEHGVLFFDCPEEVHDDEFRGFAGLFGDCYSYKYGRRSDADSSAYVGRVDHDSGANPAEKGTNVWHTDESQQELPPLACLLTPVVVPTAGGDTMWASTTAAYEALSSRYQRLLDGLQAVHSAAHAARHFSAALRVQAYGEGIDETAVHPVVGTEPLTGRKFLYVDDVHTERIVDMSESESKALLRMLFDHIDTAEFQVRLRWRVGTVAVWHERVTVHRSVADFSEKRVLRRITIRGGPVE